MKKYSIKEIHLAKLRILRDEFALKAKEDERKAKARDNQRRNEARLRAEECDMSWELVKLGIKPLRQKRLFK